MSFLLICDVMWNCDNVYQHLKLAKIYNTFFKYLIKKLLWLLA